MQASRTDNDGWRIPAKELENTIARELHQLLSDEGKLFDLITASDLSPGRIQTSSNKAMEFCDILASTLTDEKRKLVQDIIKRITVTPGHMQIEINCSKLVSLLTNDASKNTEDSVTLNIPFTLKRRGVEAKLVIENGDSAWVRPDPKLIETIAKGCTWFEQIASGQSRSVREIAQRENVDEGDVSRMIGFAFLAPDIVEAIIHGRQPIGLTAERLKRLQNLPSSWSIQRGALGFHS